MIRGFLMVLAVAWCGLPLTGARGAEPAGFAISGVITFDSKGPVYLDLVDARQFKADKGRVAGVVLKLTPEQTKARRIEYRFEAIPAGTYAIRAFQDENGNGKLDTGVFGPTEPWGMSFRKGEGKGMGPPSWDEIRFEVAGDMRMNVEVD